jgi:hypothetical protein
MNRSFFVSAEDAAAGGIPAPDQSPARDVAQIDERLTFEETLLDKTHGIFDDRLIFQVPRPCLPSVQRPNLLIMPKAGLEP